jgi:hypothetical protein
MVGGIIYLFEPSVAGFGGSFPVDFLVIGFRVFTVWDSVFVRMDQVGIAADFDFFFVCQAVAVCVGVVGVGAELVFFGVGEAVGIRIDVGDGDSPEAFFGLGDGEGVGGRIGGCDEGGCGGVQLAGFRSGEDWRVYCFPGMTGQVRLRVSGVRRVGWPFSSAQVAGMCWVCRWMMPLGGLALLGSVPAAASRAFVQPSASRSAFRS